MSNAKPTCECGANYAIGDPENEAYHHQIHEDYLLGPDIPEIQALPKIASKGALRLVVVDKSVGEPTRKKIAHVAMVAQRRMPDYKAGYYGTDSEDSRLYALVNETRIVGMVITSFEKHLWRYTWNSQNYDLNCESNDDFVSGSKISRVWTAKSYRRQGLATWLTFEVGKHLDFDVQNLGWEMPFTIHGKSLVKSVCPECFLGCGDAYSH